MYRCDKYKCLAFYNSAQKFLEGYLNLMKTFGWKLVSLNQNIEMEYTYGDGYNFNLTPTQYKTYDFIWENNKIKDETDFFTFAQFIEEENKNGRV